MTDRPVSGEQPAADAPTVEFAALDEAGAAPNGFAAGVGAADKAAAKGGGQHPDDRQSSSEEDPDQGDTRDAQRRDDEDATTSRDASSRDASSGGGLSGGGESALSGAAQPAPSGDMQTAPPSGAQTAPSGGPAPRWRRPLVLIPAGVVAGLLLLYGVAFAIAGDSLARNATVLGVEVGGVSPDEAEAILAAELPPLVDEPLDVEAPRRASTFSLVPSESGLQIDIPATVDAVPGGSANPLSLLSALFGGGEVDPVPSVDRAALEDAVAGIAEQADVEPVNGSVGFNDGEVVTSAAEFGSAVDVAATADAIERAYFGAAGPYELPLGPVTAEVDEVPPAVTDAEVERAVTEFAEPAMSGPVSVVAGDRTIELSPELISTALRMTADSDGVLRPELDAQELAEAAEGVLAELGRPGHDATIRIEGGRPVVIPSESGAGIEPEALAASVLPVLSETGDERVAEVEFSEIEPDFTTEDAEALGVEEVIGEFTTRFPHAAYRNTNIGLAASKVDGTLLMPGDTFSLNGIVGERTAANGFARGGTISGGVLVEDYGGGVSQVATTTYHAAFQAGLEDVEHKPHSIYFDRYPVAAEATVSWGNFDMAFRNDTPYGVLVQTLFSPSSPGSPGVLTVRLWSSEYYEVETSLSERSGFTEPSTIYNDEDNCIPNSVGSPGFSITSYRKVWNPDGELVKDEAYPWTYRPNPIVICGEEPSGDDDDPEPDD